MHRARAPRQVIIAAMNDMKRWIPLAILAAAVVYAIARGPYPQPEGYFPFADQRTICGVRNGGDVLSNLGFAAAGAWGLWILFGRRRDASLRAAWPGYSVFFLGVVLTALGSAYFHYAPSNPTLVWDRLPIAIACMGLVAAVRAQTRGPQPMWVLPLLVAIAAASIVWWKATGDLRPYGIVQGSIVLTPIWQWIYHAPKSDRIAIGTAIGLYLAARFFERYDREAFDVLGFMSGHTIKHLLSAAAVAVIAANLRTRGHARASATD
jgi:hypothetical protein